MLHRRSPHGLRGLKSLISKNLHITLHSRSPHGLRGLKFLGVVERSFKPTSQPSWAAWIEITGRSAALDAVKSQPSWAAWIEIQALTVKLSTRSVAALMGCVD